MAGIPDEDDVLAANESFYAAFAARDADAMEALWATGVPVACVHPGWDAIRGREDVVA
ncbi:MAG: nuclear transport factor 2 family protein, partial [Myxococcota bacterium]